MLCPWECGGRIDCDVSDSTNGKISKPEMLARAAHIHLCPNGGEHARDFYLDFRLTFKNTCGRGGCQYLLYGSGKGRPRSVVKHHNSHTECPNKCGIWFKARRSGNSASAAAHTLPMEKIRDACEAHLRVCSKAAGRKVTPAKRSVEDKENAEPAMKKKMETEA